MSLLQSGMTELPTICMNTNSIIRTAIGVQYDNSAAGFMHQLIRQPFTLQCTFLLRIRLQTILVLGRDSVAGISMSA